MPVGRSDRFDRLMRWLPRQMDAIFQDDTSMCRENERVWTMMCHVGWFEFELVSSSRIVVHDLLRNSAIRLDYSLSRDTFNSFVASFLCQVLI